VRCVRQRDRWPEAQVNLGLSLWRSGDRQGAATAFNAALAIDADNKDAIRGLAALAIEGENEQKALEYQTSLIDQGDRSPELFYNTGLILQKSGQLDDAVRLYREALALRPDFAEALLNLGHALKALGHADEARLCWSQAITAKPQLAAGYFDAE